MDCWIPWKLCLLKARQDPRQKQKCKHLRGWWIRASIHTYKPEFGPTPHPGGDGAPAVGGGGLQIWTKKGAGKVGPRKFRPRCNRILPQAASWGAWLHRIPGDLATQNALPRLLFCGEGWRVGRQQGAGKKILPWRSRIFGASAFQEIWLHKNALPGFFSVVRGSLARCEQGTSKKSYRRRN